MLIFQSHHLNYFKKNQKNIISILKLNPRMYIYYDKKERKLFFLIPFFSQLPFLLPFYLSLFFVIEKANSTIFRKLLIRSWNGKKKKRRRRREDKVRKDWPRKKRIKPRKDLLSIENKNKNKHIRKLDTPISSQRHRWVIFHFTITHFFFFFSIIQYLF